jgi:DNA-directed RNA polymerase specialized sigma subunit, sigma24 homolog
VWLLRVARDLAIDHARRQRPIAVEGVRTSDEGNGDPAGSHRMNELRNALSTLPIDQREVLVLRHFGGLSPTEIATRTDGCEDRSTACTLAGATR